uniref:Aquaporin-4 n=1 Tax=Denticeps clupeoides TaxID=299321 RepID=A0AAY4CVZ0_9TELE
MVAFKGVCTKPFWRAVSAEFLATLIFVLLSLGSTISWPASEGSASPVNLVLISLCFGLSIATMVQCFGHISGGHLNPAVTVAMVVTRKLSLAKATFYLSAQCLGAIAGAGILYLVTPNVLGVNSNITVGHALVVETVITFELIFTVFATCDPKRTDQNGSAGLAIGLSVAIGHFFAVPYTGASMNPARSFGPAVITNSWDNHWVRSVHLCHHLSQSARKLFHYSFKETRSLTFYSARSENLSGNMWHCAALILIMNMLTVISSSHI